MSQRLGTMYHSSGVRDSGENHGMKGLDINTLKGSGAGCWAQTTNPVVAGDLTLSCEDNCRALCSRVSSQYIAPPCLEVSCQWT